MRRELLPCGSYREGSLVDMRELLRMVPGEPPGGVSAGRGITWPWGCGSWGAGGCPAGRAQPETLDPCKEWPEVERVW